MNWTHGEKGPTCFCGMPTSIIVSKDQLRVDLLCFAHSNVAGAMFPLPVDGRPEHWPNMTNDEMEILVDKGHEEQDNLEE